MLDVDEGPEEQQGVRAVGAAVGEHLLEGLEDEVVVAGEGPGGDDEGHRGGGGGGRRRGRGRRREGADQALGHEAEPRRVDALNSHHLRGGAGAEAARRWMSGWRSARTAEQGAWGLPGPTPCEPPPRAWPGKALKLWISRISSLTRAPLECCAAGEAAGQEAV